MKQYAIYVVAFGAIVILTVMNMVMSTTVIYSECKNCQYYAREILSMVGYIAVSEPEPTPEPIDLVEFEDNLRRFIFSSPRVVVLQYEPGPDEGQYWHYHRYRVPLGTRYMARCEWILCAEHWCDYPTATSFIEHTVERCEDPYCELPRFYQPTWRLSRRNESVSEEEEY